MEKYLQRAVIDYIDHQPYCRVVNIHGSSCQEKDISDLLLCCHGLYVALELKDESEITNGQLAFLRSIRRAKGIAEIINDISTVKDIIQCVRSGRAWEPISDLSPRRRGSDRRHRW